MENHFQQENPFEEKQKTNIPVTWKKHTAILK